MLTEEERYEIQTKPESQLKGEIPANAKQLTGYFPAASSVRLMNAANLNNIFTSADTSKATPCITGIFLPGKGDDFFMIHNTATAVSNPSAVELAAAEQSRQQLANRIDVRTPDSFLNTLGGALSMAADAIWEDPSFMHGAVAWAHCVYQDGEGRIPRMYWAGMIGPEETLNPMLYHRSPRLLPPV